MGDIFCRKGIDQAIADIAEYLFDNYRYRLNRESDKEVYISERDICAYLHETIEKLDIIGTLEDVAINFVQTQSHEDCYSYDSACELGMESVLDMLRSGDKLPPELEEEINNRSTVSCGECGTGDLFFNKAIDAWKCDTCLREISRKEKREVNL